MLSICPECGAQFALKAAYLTHRRMYHPAVDDDVLEYRRMQTKARRLEPGDKVRMVRNAGGTAHEGAVGTYVGPSDSRTYPLKVKFPNYIDPILVEPAEVVYISEAVIHEDPL